jgi:hypothetical protein
MNEKVIINKEIEEFVLLKPEILTFSVRHLNAIKSTVGQQWT